MKKSEVYHAASIAVLSSDLENEKVLEILKVLIDAENVALLLEEGEGQNG